jgi:tRNA threonylcarbamoyladenosine biosynthesis protein TsaB
MIVLAIDAALAACSAALVRDGQTLAALSEPMERGHAERLAPLVDELMRGAGVAFAHLDRIVVTVGPGSFTGVRVGLSFARGLALALGKPCVGVSTLEALAGEGSGVRAGAVAGAGEVYFAAYGDGETLVAPGRLAIEDARALAPPGVTVRGPAAEIFRDCAAEIEVLASPDVATLARLGAARDPAAHPPTPQYLRAPDAKLPGGKTLP